MRKIVRFFVFIPVLCFTHLLFPVTEKINLDYVDFQRIEYAAKKYEHLYSKFKWNRGLKYTVIGVGCVCIAALLASSFTDMPIKAEGGAKKAETTPSKEDLEIKKLKLLTDFWERKNKEKTGGKIKKNAMRALYFVFYTAVSSVLATTFWSLFNKGSDLLNTNFGGIDLQDFEFYKQKNDKISVLMKNLGAFLMQQEKDTDNQFNINVFDLMFSDVLLGHTTLVRWFEDIIGFIKCAVILDAGAESPEVANLQNEVIALSCGLNKFSDDLAVVINYTGGGDRVVLLEQAASRYLVFCKHFSKFIYDYGFYLYEQDFLHK